MLNSMSLSTNPMKSLSEIYQTYKLPAHGISDKGTSHSYIEVYDRLFAPFQKRQPIRMLEIGLCRGGSLRMWRDYFDKSEIHGIDINLAPDGFPDLQGLVSERLSRMTISIVDARNPVDVFNHLGDARFDIIVEDASHKLSDSVAIYAHFIHRLNDGGLYIIEDVEDIDAARPVLDNIFKPRKYEVLDLRKKKNRFDDVLIVVR